MNNRERMLKGFVYDPTAGDIMGDQQACNEIMYDYNATRPSEKQKRHEILKKLLGSMGKNTYIEPPLHANWGKNTHVGDDFYANFNLTLVDDADIYIGDNVMIGPNVVIATAGHPILPSLRKKGMQFNIPVFYRQQRMDRCGSARHAGRKDRRQFGYRCGQRRHQGYPRKLRRVRQSVQAAPSDRRARQTILFSRQKNRF